MSQCCQTPISRIEKIKTKQITYDPAAVNPGSMLPNRDMTPVVTPVTDPAGESESGLNGGMEPNGGTMPSGETGQIGGGSGQIGGGSGQIGGGIGSISDELLPAPEGGPLLVPADPPGIFENPPFFRVPANPLLPPGYQEILNYNNLQYANGFYRTQIGRYVKVELLISSNTIVRRFGFLIGVGINYILLQDAETQNIRVLDAYNIKDMYVYYDGVPTSSQMTQSNKDEE